MNRNKKILVALLALLIITIPAGILSWVFFFRESAPGQPDLKYADIMISNHSLEDEILTFTVKNQGEENANGIEVVVQIESLALVLYDNSLNPLDLASSGTSEIQINLTEYFSYFTGRFIYSIDLEIDPDDLIEELSEVNNFITIDYTFAPEGMILPNTYTYNSTIENLGYAITFHENQILLENSLNISKGHINGYSLVNSTVLNSSTLLNPESKVSIALYGNQNLTLKNIWDISLSLMVFNNASVLLENSSIYDIQSFGNTSITLINSSVMYFITSGSENDKGLFNIKDNSSVDLIINRVSSEMEIESSSLSNLILQPNPSLNMMEGYDITGEIIDSTIDSIGSFGHTNVFLSHTNITTASLMGNSKANFHKCILSSLSSGFSSKLILNESQVLATLTYGIIINSGSVNITNGEIQGNYLNTTTLINSNVSDSSYNSIMVNGTGQLSISNFSSMIFMYDSAQLIINESSINSTAEYVCFIQDSAELIGNNCSIETLLAYGAARIYLDNSSFVNLALLNNSNINDIRNTSLSQVILISDNQNGELSRFTNCSIDELFVYPSHRVNLTNSTINNLFEGYILNSGDIIIDPSGISGPGTYTNYIDLENTICYNRTVKYLTIKEDINVSINNLYKELVIQSVNGSLTIFNSTIDSLLMQFGSRATVNNCTFEGFDGTLSQISILFAGASNSIICYGNSSLHICNNTKIPNQLGIQFHGNSEVMIDNSLVELVNILDGAKLMISNSEITHIIVNAYRPEEYSVLINDSKIDTLITYSWSFIHIDLITIFTSANF